MRATLVLATALVGSLAQAHIEPGTWTGVGVDNGSCIMEVGPQTFENNVPHPLNERIQIKVGNDTYSVRHPSVIDPKTATASFNHDQFEAILATPEGAQAIVIEMAHSPEFEGPTKFTVISHKWKTNVKIATACSDLKQKN